MISSVHSLNFESYLSWILNRLKYKYQENDHVLSEFIFKTKEYLHIKKNISDEQLNEICRHFYQDWDLPKCEINIGMNEEEKQKTKSFIRELLTHISQTL